MPREEGLIPVSMTKQSLVRIKCKALRSRVWFSALSQIERAIINLTIKCVERVRSQTLATSISDIMGKILNILGNGFMERAEKVGLEIAENLFMVAQRWGNKDHIWMRSEIFIKFLGVNALNT